MTTVIPDSETRAPERIVARIGRGKTAVRRVYRGGAHADDACALRERPFEFAACEVDVGQCDIRRRENAVFMGDTPNPRSTIG